MTESTSPARPVRQERRRRGRIGRVASGAVAVVVLVVGGATPARAEPRSTMAIDPTGDLASPPTASGTFTGPSLLGLPVEKITGVTLAVSPSGPTGGSDVTQNGCDVGTGCDTADVEYTWQIPGLDYNGPYVVNATASYCPVLGCAGAPETTSAEPAQFRLGVDPRAPSDVRVAAGTDRSVVVSWARNGEPDIQHYALFRKDPGGDFRRLGGDIEQPDSGRPTFTDTGVAGTGGGDFTYRVFAVRNGFSGDTSTNRISKASADRATTVPPPPVTTVAPGTDPNAPPVTIAGEGVDISSFLSGQAPALPAPAPVFLDLPDTGFGQTLPFGGLPDEAEPGEADAVLPRTPRERQIAQFQRNRPLIPVAAGAILLVLAGHIRLLNVRTKPTVAPKKLPPGTYVARALEAARSNQVPIDVASAVANGGHHRAPPGDDVARLPVWAEFEPVSAVSLLPTSPDNDDTGLADDDGDDDRDGDREDDGARRLFAPFAPSPPSAPQGPVEVEIGSPPPHRRPAPVLRSQFPVEARPAVARGSRSGPRPQPPAPPRPPVPEPVVKLRAQPAAEPDDDELFDAGTEWEQEPPGEREVKGELLDLEAEWEPALEADGLDPESESDGLDSGLEADGLDLGSDSDGLDPGLEADGLDSGSEAWSEVESESEAWSELDSGSDAWSAVESESEAWSELDSGSEAWSELDSGSSSVPEPRPKAVFDPQPEPERELPSRPEARPERALRPRAKRAKRGRARGARAPSDRWRRAPAVPNPGPMTNPGPVPTPAPETHPPSARGPAETPFDQAPAVRSHAQPVPVPASVAAPPPPAPPEPVPVPEPAYDFEADMDPALLYAFDQEAQWSPDPGQEPEREAVPPPGDDAELAYAFDDQSEWAGEPEVFVSPRR